MWVSVLATVIWTYTSYMFFIWSRSKCLHLRSLSRPINRNIPVRIFVEHVCLRHESIIGLLLATNYCGNIVQRNDAWACWFNNDCINAPSPKLTPDNYWPFTPPRPAHAAQCVCRSWFMPRFRRIVLMCHAAQRSVHIWSCCDDNRLRLYKRDAATRRHCARHCEDEQYTPLM